MIFLSKPRNYRAVLKSSSHKYVQVQGQDGLTKVPAWGTTVEFKPVADPGIRVHGNTYRGKAKVTDPDTIAGMLAHPGYNNDFIGIDEDGREAFPDTAFVSPNGDGSFTCSACDQVIKNAQGVPGHCGSDRHTENVDDYITRAKESIRAA